MDLSTLVALYTTCKWLCQGVAAAHVSIRTYRKTRDIYRWVVPNRQYDDFVLVEYIERPADTSSHDNKKRSERHVFDTSGRHGGGGRSMF